MSSPSDVESASWDEIRSRQVDALRDQLQYLEANSAFYRDRLSDVDVESITDVSDLTEVPMLTKDEIRESLGESPPLGEHACTDWQSIVQVQSSSGTTGRPTYVGVTESDLQTWRETVARVYETNGFQPGESCLHAYGLSKGFVGGLPIVQGLEERGVNVLPIGAESGAERLLRAIDDLEPENLVATPNFALYLGRQSESILGRPAKDLSVKRVSCGGEPGLDAMRDELQRTWGADVYQVMGATEVAPAYFAECEHRNLHMVRPDLYLPEILDPETEDQLDWEEGTTGELVVTTLQREASPVLRYRLGDVVTVHETDCPCGRTMPALTCHGRTDDMLIVRGVNVFPSAVQDVINEFDDETTGHFRIRKTFDGHSTERRLPVVVEYAEGRGDDAADIERRLTESLQSRLGVSADVEMVSPETFERPEDGKVSLIVEE